ncbi:hypothetical protein [Flavobacterium sp. B183]|uniref:hypothetical protein n=1 Tax=Flavobacterium sp. B183 TaxID=907046 RepID=UPI00201F2D44|nr:hypothetical protein [Flavobacterium sp. B183]URC11439.1 hypothetical protein M4I44_15195 [Flavobacterium sp. B183]
MKLIKLTLHKLSTIYISTDHIVAFFPHPQKGSEIIVTNGINIPVNESIEAIKEKIER